MPSGERILKHAARRMVEIRFKKKWPLAISGTRPFKTERGQKKN